jgi:hypothetical protein
MSTMRYYNPQLRGRLLALLRSGYTVHDVMHCPAVRAALPAWLTSHTRWEYIVRANLSMVSWACPWQMRLLRAHAKIMTRMTGVRHVVDHKIPLTHARVSGLTWHGNMRVVTYAVNAAKGNKWNPDQLELTL